MELKVLFGACQTIEHSNKNKSDIQLVSMKNLYESRLNYLSTNIWRIEPCYNPFIEFLNFEKEEESIYSNISNFGMIDSIFADNCLISRNDKQRIIENEEFKFEIISYLKYGNEIKKEMEINLKLKLKGTFK